MPFSCFRIRARPVTSGFGGAEGIRTPDLLIANETRYQLRHSPGCAARREEEVITRPRMAPNRLARRRPPQEVCLEPEPAASVPTGASHVRTRERYPPLMRRPDFETLYQDDADPF